MHNGKTHQVVDEIIQITVETEKPQLMRQKTRAIGINMVNMILN